MVLGMSPVRVRARVRVRVRVRVNVTYIGAEHLGEYNQGWLALALALALAFGLGLVREILGHR